MSTQSDSPHVLLTGSNGFVGRALLHGLAGSQVRTAGREEWMTGNASMAGVQVVVHLAARVHVMRDTDPCPLAAFRLANVEGTMRLAAQAAGAGVKRFIFVSSIKVNGESTLPGQRFTENDAPNPQDAYGQSKSEAEIALRKMGSDSGMEITIVRPPLVYGPGAKANFAALMRAVQKGWPLPLGCVDNQRSLVALDNLVSFLLTCIEHPRAANQTFLVSDGQDVSVAQLVRGMAKACGQSARLLPVPVWALQAAATLLGKQGAVQRLCTDLRLDISKARDVLGWNPPVTMEEGLRRAIQDTRKE